MNTFKTIRDRLELTQAEMALLLDVSQGSVSFYESGKTPSPLVAQKLIEIAKSHGIAIGFDDIYASVSESKAAA